MTFRLVLLLLVLQRGNAPPTPPVEKGSIEGTVVRLGTREPLEDVRVVLMSNAPGEVPDLVQPAPIFSVSTDSQGRFSFRTIEPGAYRLTFSANGYVRQEYGQRTLPGRGTLINLSAGQVMKDLVTEMTPAGSVSGTIRDRDKRPLARVPVQLMRVGYDQEGDRRLRPNASTTLTDDRGEFRIYFVTPGRYYLNAGTPQGPPGTGDRSLAANEVQETYAYVYYPGVADLKFATPIDIQPGTATTGMDLMLNRIRGVRVSGRIIDSTTGQPPENPQVRLAYRDPGVPWDYDLESMGRGKVTYKNGTFEFRDVVPGVFAVFASVDELRDPTSPSGTQPLQRRGYVPVEVANSDVEGIVVTVSPGTSISGWLRAEGQESLTSAFMPINGKIGITLNPSSNGGKPSTPGVPAPTYGVLNPDGTFRIDNMMPGEFRIEIGWLKPQYYVKEARFGVTDVLKSPFQYSGRESGSLEIVLSPNVASVEGVVSDRLTAAAGAQVVLVPDQSRHRTELFKTATTDQNGRFKMPNIPPGDYRLYAWEAIEPYGWFDPDLLKRDEQSARPVRLTESARQTIDARLIPAK